MQLPGVRRFWAQSLGSILKVVGLLSFLKTELQRFILGEQLLKLFKREEVTGPVKKAARNGFGSVGFALSSSVVETNVAVADASVS